jgi:hypothetical protein
MLLYASRNVRRKPMPITGTAHAWSRVGSFVQPLPTLDTPA